MKFDARKKIFRGISKAEFEAAKEKHDYRRDHSSEPATGSICRNIRELEELGRYRNTPYFKIIIEGGEWLWLASPVYRHNDYNKCRWAPNTPKERRKAEIVNKIISR